MSYPRDWVKACGTSSCVEVRGATYGGVEIRSSQNPERVLQFTDEEWWEFAEGVKDGDFDRVRVKPHLRPAFPVQDTGRTGSVSASG